jgi:16S rRNA (cytidine1402-2'-O)-methyltransferase
MSRLYVIATPIGNLEDASPRALRLLAEVGLIAAEDTRVALVLLRHFGIETRLISFHENNKARRLPQLLEHLTQGDLALVCDAGTPAISDPGLELVAGARAAGHEIVAVPGPSAPIAALSVAGLRALPFSFVGFLPRGAGELRKLLAQYTTREETLVAFESPQRLRQSLALLAEVLPGRRVAVCRELSKLHEEVFVGSAAEALAHFTAPRGEIVLVVEGATVEKAPQPGIPDEARGEAASMLALGLTRVQATALLSQRWRLSRRQAYRLWLDVTNDATAGPA